MTDKNINSTIYFETIEDLRAKINSDYTSVSNFCEKNDIDNLTFTRYLIILKAKK